MLQKGFIEKFKKQIQDGIKRYVKDEAAIGGTMFTDTIHAVREDIKGEYDAIRQYEEHVNLYRMLFAESGNEVFNQLIAVTQDIIREEEVHVGELNELLNKVDPEQMQKFEEGVREAQEKLGATNEPEQEAETVTDKDVEIWDERLSPQTYRKLKEMGYTREKWKNLTQEQANRIVHGNEGGGNTSTKQQEQPKQTEKKPQEAQKASGESTKPAQSEQPKLAVPEGAELRQRIFSDTEGKMSIDDIVNSDIVHKMKADAKQAEKDIRAKYNMNGDETVSTADIDTPERKQMRADITKKMLSRGSVGVDERGKTKKDKDGNVIYDGPVKKEYRAEIVLGAPAGGKSSVIVDKVSKNTGSMVLDSDEIKKEIPEFSDGKGAGLVHKESADIILENMVVPQFGKGGSMEGTNLTIPIVGKNPKAALRYLKLLKAAGYNVHLSLNEVSELNSIKRATTRAIETGRFLDPAYLQSIGTKPDQTYQYLKEFDEDGVHFDTFTKYNNDVPFGQPAKLLEHSGFGGAEVEKEDWR